MTTPARLPYPALCLGPAGFWTVPDASALERGTGDAQTHRGLRIIDATGNAHEVVGVRVVHPRSSIGRAAARIFDAPVRVTLEMRALGPADVGDIVTQLRSHLDSDPQSVEELTERPAEWWHGELANCRSPAEVVRLVESTHSDDSGLSARQIAHGAMIDLVCNSLVLIWLYAVAFPTLDLRARLPFLLGSAWAAVAGTLLLAGLGVAGLAITRRVTQSSIVGTIPAAMLSYGLAVSGVIARLMPATHESSPRYGLLAVSAALVAVILWRARR